MSPCRGAMSGGHVGGSGVSPQTHSAPISPRVSPLSIKCGWGEEGGAWWQDRLLAWTAFYPWRFGSLSDVSWLIDTHAFNFHCVLVIGAVAVTLTYLFGGGNNVFMSKSIFQILNSGHFQCSSTKSLKKSHWQNSLFGHEVEICESYWQDRSINILIFGLSSTYTISSGLAVFPNILEYNILEYVMVWSKRSNINCFEIWCCARYNFQCCRFRSIGIPTFVHYCL